MVFLRPMVVRDASASDRLSVDRYEQMRAFQSVAQPEPSRMVPINEAPVFQQLQRPSGQAPAAAEPVKP